MTSTTRNLLGVFAGLVAGYVALAVAATVDYELISSGYNRYETELSLRLAIVWPFLLSASVLGLVAGAIVDARPARLWASVVAAVAAVQYLFSQYYVAPNVRERAMTIVSIVVVAAVDAGVF